MSTCPILEATLSQFAVSNFEIGDAQRVLDGDIDGFVPAYLLQAAERV